MLCFKNISFSSKITSFLALLELASPLNEYYDNQSTTNDLVILETA
ncbi:hypothetical protein C7377_1117 [Balneicella halophila]|uniref:Uncharacterized protein n=1 Tax=Balneicella halophila TaxID=1537566 RepID=A0A7L4UNN6_BALHA|nr:hypothetical protein C7377_1117 [Balneicella halophila]